MADKKKAVHPPSRTVGLLQLPLQGVPKMSQGLLSYEPTLREKIANAVYDGSVGLLGKRKAHEMQANTKSAVDFVPGLGDAVGANDMARDYRAGNYGMAALSAIGLIPAVGDVASKVGKKALANAPEGIRAFHGSPHSFDKFSLDKIGTGEGAQAYGHGLYFADNETVARGYRDALTGNHAGDMAVFVADGKEIPDPSPVLKNIVRNGGDPLKFIESLQPNLERKRAALKAASKDDALGLGFSDYDLAKMDLDEFEGMIAEANSYVGKNVGTKAPGSMYEVNIRANPDDFLDWDKPLSEQSQKVKDALASGSRSLDGFDSFDPNRLVYEPEMAGNRIYERAKFAGGSPQDAREVLANQGIPGIKYLDAGSRGAGDGSRNYVVFDEKLIDIVRKYGLASAIGAGIISKEMGQQMQAQGDI